MDGEPQMEADCIGAVQSVLAAFPGLAGVVVVEHGADPAEQCLIGYVAPSGPGLDLSELHAHARKALRNGSMPAAIVVVDEIPVTPAGTVDLAALPVPDLNGLLPYRAPATPRQEILCDLFAEVLGVARCGVDNDFFDLAGRSVEAMVLAGRISTAFGVRISMADLFRAPTAADIDRRLDVIAEPRQ
jgi:acyl carrier protein